MAHLVLSSPTRAYTGAYLRNDFIPEASLALMGDRVAELRTGPHDQTITLYGWDCKVPNPVPDVYPPTVRNCTEACADPRYMFQNSRTLFNCAVLASTDLLVRAGRLELDAESRALNGTRGFDASAALDALAVCAADGCRDARGVACSPDLTATLAAVRVSLTRNDTDAAVRGTHEFLESYCDDVPPAPGLLTVGPGVLIASCVQTLLALTFFGLLTLFTSGAARLATYPFFRLRRLVAPVAADKAAAAPSAWAAASSLQHALARSRPAAALFTAAASFHDVQLWFTLAVQAAGLVATLGALPVPSFAAKYLNDDLLLAVAVNAFLPCLLTELLLRRTRRPARPTPRTHLDVLLVSATWFLGCAVLATGDGPSYPSPARRVARAAPLSPACGANPPLAALCGLERGPATGAPLLLPAFFAVGVGYPVLPALWLQTAAWALACRGLSDAQARARARQHGLGLVGLLARRAAAGARGFATARSVWAGLVHGVWRLFTAATLVFLLFNAVVLARLVAFVDLRAPLWNAAEVAALAVWVPTALRALYLLFCESLSLLFPPTVASCPPPRGRDVCANVCSAVVGVEKTALVWLNGDYEVVRRDGEELGSEAERTPLANPAANCSTESVAEPPYKVVPEPPYKDVPEPPYKDVPEPPYKDVPEPLSKDVPELPSKDAPEPPHKDVPEPPYKDAPKLPHKDVPELAAADNVVSR